MGSKVKIEDLIPYLRKKLVSRPEYRKIVEDATEEAKNTTSSLLIQLALTEGYEDEDHLDERETRLTNLHSQLEQMAFVLERLEEELRMLPIPREPGPNREARRRLDQELAKMIGPQVEEEQQALPDSED